MIQPPPPTLKKVIMNHKMEKNDYNTLYNHANLKYIVYFTIDKKKA